jgi:hypothetical protein
MVSSLRRAYGTLLAAFGFHTFKARDAAALLKLEGVNVLLHRLCEGGYLERVSRGVFRVVHPIALALEWSGYDWRERIRQREYLPLLELVVARLIEGLGGSLHSLVLFGSIAKGEARAESDLDLLIVSEDLPMRYSDRLKLFRELTRGVEGARMRLWRERGLYPLIDAILLTPEEASLSHPFYLDMMEEAVIVFDRDGFMEKKLEKLRERLKELGARRIQLLDGTWYWELKPTIKPGEVIEL